MGATLRGGNVSDAGCYRLARRDFHPNSGHQTYFFLAFIVFASWAVALFSQSQLIEKIQIPLLWCVGLDSSIVVLGTNFFAVCCLYLYRRDIGLNPVLAAVGVIVAACLP